jgi:hypothetical protein
MSFVAHPACCTVREELWYMKNSVVIGMQDCSNACISCKFSNMEDIHWTIMLYVFEGVTTILIWLWINKDFKANNMQCNGSSCKTCRLEETKKLD